MFGSGTSLASQRKTSDDECERVSLLQDSSSSQPGGRKMTVSARTANRLASPTQSLAFHHTLGRDASEIYFIFDMSLLGHSSFGTVFKTLLCVSNGRNIWTLNSPSAEPPVLQPPNPSLPQATYSPPRVSSRALRYHISHLCTCASAPCSAQA